MSEPLNADTVTDEELQAALESGLISRRVYDRAVERMDDPVSGDRAYKRRIARQIGAACINEQRAKKAT